MEPTSVPIFIIHVKKGYEDRQKHIDRMLKGKSYQYVTDYDISDITEDDLNKRVKGDLVKAMPAVSCAMKHLECYRLILNNNLPGALVLEDDIVLHKRFGNIFERSLKEADIQGYLHEASIINYEDTRLRFIPRSQRKAGQTLYKGDRDRMTGAYYITANGADAILDYVKKNKLSEPIDLLHNTMLKHGLLTYLWSQPTVATQGSHVGKFKSSINFKQSRIDPLRWQLKRMYKRALYLFR